MRIEKKRGPFKTLDIYLERPSLSDIESLQKRYARLSILTHEPLDVPSDFRLRHKKTPNIYLNAPLETILSRFRDTVRNEVHRTERLLGFEVRLPDNDRQSAYDVYRAFEFSQKRAPISRDEFKHFALAGAYLNGRFLSGITFFRSGDTIRIRSIFSVRLGTTEDRELYKTVGYATKRLIYEICRYGIVHGARLIDLASINLTDPEKEPIARFKSGFGAKIEDEYQYIGSSSIYRLVEQFGSWSAKLRSRWHV